MVQISVIIPVYMTEQYIVCCIESVLKQTFQNFELILVDDGSPDNCGKICDEYAKKDSRIKVIHQENRGVSSARNHGIEVATGEYIVFIDSDDWVETNYLADLLMSDADFVSQSFSTYDEQGHLIKRQSNYSRRITLNQDNILTLLEDGILGYTVSKRFTLKILKDNGIKFEENIDHTEDTLFVIDYLRCARTAQIEDKCNYFYVRYNTRITLSGQITIERLAMVCTTNHIICKRFFPQDSIEYEKLYYSRIGYNYMSYIGHMWYSNLKGVLQKYFFGCELIRNKDVNKIIKYAPDALWKLSAHEKVIQALYKGDRLHLIYACLYEFFSKQKQRYKKKKTQL